MGEPGCNPSERGPRGAKSARVGGWSRRGTPRQKSTGERNVTGETRLCRGERGVRGV